MVRLFTPSPSKRRIRKLVDLPAIKRKCSHLNRKLRYFGLPSEGFYDVMDWLSYIDEIVAAERGDPYDPERKQSILLSKAIRLGIHERLTLLRGEINEIILQGRDSIGQELTYPFELVNFDYGGALLYPDRFRIKALEHFVRLQNGTDFLLLMTLNIREHDPNEITATEGRIKTEITQVSPERITWLSNFFKWMNEMNSPLRQIIHLLYLLKGLAEMNHYQIAWEPPTLYKGSKETILIHYLTDFSFDPHASTKTVSSQSVVDILNVCPRIIRSGKPKHFESLSRPPKMALT